MPDWKLWLVVPLLCAWPLRILADDNEVAKLIAECGSEDLPQASLDSCLESVRVLEETEPSAQLQSLEGRLERREGGKTMSARTEPTFVPQADISRPEHRASPGALEEDGPSTENDDRDRAQSLSGSETDDQPPVADPPSGASEDPPDGDQTDNPE
jgi:hypothetical protein